MLFGLISAGLYYRIAHGIIGPVNAVVHSAVL